MLLVSARGSTRDALLVMLNLPLAMIGGVAGRRGAIERLAPILMTAIATALGLLPLVLASGEPGSEIQAPMAVVILFGLASSTALNMVVVPALYLRFGRYRARP